MAISLHPELAHHLSIQKLRLPQKSAIYDFRLAVDFCSMLYARDHVFNADAEYTLHLRLDSSPQFNRNYMVGEVDRVCLSAVSPEDIDSVSFGVALMWCWC